MASDIYDDFMQMATTRLVWAKKVKLYACSHVCACLCACPLPAKVMLLIMPHLLEVGRLLSQVHFDVHSGSSN